MEPFLIVFRQYQNFWRKAFLHGLLTSFTINLSTTLLAQNLARGIKFERIGTEQGLSHDRLHDTILQDRQGFMWFVTTGGLNKYDGYNFTVYKSDPGNPHSLSDYRIRSLYEDRAGVLWVGTWFGGLNKFNRETETFTRYQHDPNNPNSLSDNTVRSIYEDRAGVLWIGTTGGLNKFDRKKETFTHYRHDPQNPNSLGDNWVWSLYEDRVGVFWVGTNSGLNKFDREKETFTRYLHDPNNLNSLSAPVIRGISEDRFGVLWIDTAGGGLNKFDREKEVFIHYKHDPKNPTSLSHNSVGAPYEDRAGILWIASWGGGINKFDRDKEQFTHYKNDPNNPNSLSYNCVSSFVEDSASRNLLWIGTSWGRRLNRLNKFDRKTETFTRYQHDPENPNSLSHDQIESLYVDRSGVLWIGTIGGGLNKFDREKESFTRYQHDPNNPYSLSNNLVSSFYEDRTGVLWIGTLGGGLNKFDRDKERFTHYKNDPDDPNSLSHNWVFSLYEDSTSWNVLWIGTEGGGLNKFDREKEVFTRYRQRDGLLDDVICGILEDDHGLLWLSTHNGLCRFDPQTAEFRNYDISDGLQGKEFNPGAYHKSRRTGEMFFGGLNGFNIFHPDSVRDNPYIPPVVITAFKRYNLDKPDGEPIIEKGISVKQELTLSYKDNILFFEFAALSYRNTHKNQYAYKLEGFNDNWIHLGTKRDITFTGLDPGEYTLRVKGSNNDGVWNEEGTSLKITITPPWWQTRWAYAFYVLFFTILLYGLRHYELRRLRLRNELKIKNIEAEKLLEVDRLKSRFYAGISHEFRTPLTLILGPVEKWLSHIQQSDMKADFHIVQRNARRLQQLINQLLDLSKLEAGRMKLQARPENMAALLRMITMTFESLAKQKGIDLQFHAPEEEVIAYVERDKMETMVTNLLANAFKFTGKGGRISVQLSLSNEQLSMISEQLSKQDKRNDSSGLPFDHCLLITVKDTGIGIPADQLDKIFDRFHQVDNRAGLGGTGIGLALTKELVELHHGAIAVESETGKGTTFIVRLPLGKQHLQPEQIMETDFNEQLSIYGDRLSEIDEQSLKPSDKQPAISNEQPTLLIVEDNPDMRAYMRGYLKENYRIVEAEDGAQGMKQAINHAPDLIISDVMMPEMDGFELCEKLKTDERTSHIPVILLTARASGESKVEGLEIGADDYLTKPFNAKELQVRVRNLIELRRRLQERFRRELVIQPSEVTATPMDEAFLKKVMAAVEAHIDDASFETDDLAREVAISGRQLNRKLRALTGQSVREFIRTIRLKRAAQLLQQQAGTVTEIAYQVGFNSIAHFAKIFREQFGVAPSEFSGSSAGSDS